MFIQLFLEAANGPNSTETEVLASESKLPDGECLIKLSLNIEKVRHHLITVLSFVFRKSLLE